MAKKRTARKRTRKASARPIVAFHRSLRDRLGEAADGLTFQEISRLTGYHPENVRRYMGHGRVPAHFLTVFADAMEVSASWLLVGEGSKKARRK